MENTFYSKFSVIRKEHIQSSKLSLKFLSLTEVL